MVAWGVLALLVLLYRGLPRFECLAAGNQSDCWQCLPDVDATFDSELLLDDTRPKSVGNLLEAIRSGEALSGETALALASLGPAVAPALIAAFKDTNVQVRLVAIRSITAMARQLEPGMRGEAVVGLIPLVNDEDSEVRFAAVLALGFGGRAEKATPTLIAALRETAPESDENAVNIRAAAARVLEESGLAHRAQYPNSIE